MKAPLRVSVIVSNGGRRNLHETGSQEDDGVDQTNEPIIVLDAKLLGETQVGTVGTCLIPTLGGSADGAQRYRIPQHLGAVPLVVSLVGEGRLLLLVELGEVGELEGVARNEGGAAEEGGVLGHAFRLGEGVGVEDGLLPGDAL